MGTKHSNKLVNKTLFAKRIILFFPLNFLFFLIMSTQKKYFAFVSTIHFKI